MRHGVFLPPFNAFSDPHRVIALAISAEEAGWDGLFLWDHVLRRPEQAAEVADPWATLAGVAISTTTLRIGTMVTPLVRRRPQVLARQVVTLDHLSGGRVTIGLGLGVDSTGELSRFGEVVDERERGRILDEGAELMAQFLAGEHVEHKGQYFTADGVQLLPRSLQEPRVPMWFGAQGSNPRPLRRAARYEGAFLVGATAEDVKRAVDRLTEARGGLDGFDLAVDSEVASTAGVTWSMSGFSPESDPLSVEERVAAGPRR